MTKNSFVAEVTLSNLLNGVLLFGYRKKEDDMLLIKINICRWKRGSFLSEIEITRVII